jgi:hypothetical protein
MVTAGMIDSSLSVVGPCGGRPGRSKACATRWHAHPFIKSSHVATFCNQFLARISAGHFLPIKPSNKFEQEMPKRNAGLSAWDDGVARRTSIRPRRSTNYVGARVCNNVQSIRFVPGELKAN